jgi:inosine-uridine nucleoside N-ribohydrolase
MTVPTPILIDCDPGHDDAMALLLALASPELDVVGVSTVHGNTTLANTTVNALKILELAGRTEIPVARGADRPLTREPRVAAHVHGESGLDGPDLPDPTTKIVEAHGVDFLADTLRAASEPITLIPTGPLTNIALLLAQHPDITDKIERIVLMGGAIAEGNITPAAEFNIWVDPEAAARVFASDVDTTMVGLDVTHRALMTPAHADTLKESGRIGDVVAQLFAFYNRFHSRVYDLPGSPVHDALAVAHVARGDLLTTKPCHVAVDCASELCRGRTVVDLWHVTGNEPNAHVATEVEATTFIDLLVERIGSLG